MTSCENDSLDATETADICELCVERHRPAATGLRSNRDPTEWLAVTPDPLFAQSAVNRLKSAASELIFEGESYHRDEKPLLGDDPTGNTKPARPSGEGGCLARSDGLRSPGAKSLD